MSSFVKVAVTISLFGTKLENVSKIKLKGKKRRKVYTKIINIS